MNIMPSYYISIQKWMLSKFTRQSNSEKYSSRCDSPEQLYSMSLADMDIGHYPPLQSKIICAF